MSRHDDAARGPATGLRAAVDDAYSVFGRYHRTKPLNVCRCPSCVTPEEERQLGAYRLTELPSKVLAAYTRSAHEYDPAVDGDTFRHFLPRYFELIAAGDAPDSFGDVYFCLSRLGLTGYRTDWPAPEVEVIDRFFDEIILHGLSDDRISQVPAGACPTLRAHELFVMAATAGADVARSVALLHSAPDPACAMHIAAMAGNVAFESGDYTFKTPLIGAETPMARALGKAITSPGMLHRLEAAFLSTTDQSMQEILARGVDILAIWCGSDDREIKAGTSGN